MPTIELVSINCAVIPNVPDYSTFAHIMEPALQSHRALFQGELDKFNGVIVHLADKDLEGGFPWFAGGLVEFQDNDRVKFKEKCQGDLRDLFRRLLLASPEGQVLFLTDYQFGPETAEVHGATLDEPEFWRMHDSGVLMFNHLYRVTSVSVEQPH